jgi:hypothetical protein
MWDSSVAQRNTSSVLPSLPTIDGIWAQGGTDGVLKAFISAGRSLPPTAGEAENGFRKFMIGYQGHKVEGLSIGQPPFLSIVALELARRILRGDYPKQDVTILHRQRSESNGQDVLEGGTIRQTLWKQADGQPAQGVGDGSAGAVWKRGACPGTTLTTLPQQSRPPRSRRRSEQ